MIGYIEEEEDIITDNNMTSDDIRAAEEDAFVGENTHGRILGNSSSATASTSAATTALPAKRASIRLTAAGVTLPFPHGLRLPPSDPMVSKNIDCTYIL